MEEAAPAGGLTPVLRDGTDAGRAPGPSTAGAPPSIEAPFPLEGTWETFLDRLRGVAPPDPAAATRDTYLDAAERIVRSLAAWQDDDGLIVDPWAADRYYVTNRDGRRVLVHTQTRYLGALGQLLRAGRCPDLLDGGVAAYEERLRHLDEVRLAPEFYTKELVWAYLGMRERVEPERRRRWEAVWAAHLPWRSYRCAETGEMAGLNFAAFAVAGEALKQWAGLGGDSRMVEEGLAYLSGDFTDWGMYRDPGDPMTYDLVVKQQLDLVRHCGYDGPWAAWVDEICRRGAIASLLMQSACGQMPFGGRSNQFHFVEGHFACLCETQAARYRRRCDRATAAVFRRAGRRAAALTLPWILEMDPFRHTKQGFHPQLGHGVDSGGPHSVYGALAASLFATAYHLADGEAEERPTPAEVGGFAFELWPAFHKVFAAAGGYSVEVDTRADPEKDATGLGRLQRCGVRSETALAGSITAGATYDVGVARPGASLAIGPAWRTGDGGKHRLDASGDETEGACPNAPRDGTDEHHLAALSDQIDDVRLSVLREDPECVVFEIAYCGDLGGCRRVVEEYRLTGAGLEYRVRAEPEPEALCVLVPVIESDGEVYAEVAETPAGVTVAYRGGVYRVAVPPGGQWRLRREPLAANRNALYRCLEVRGDAVHLSLNPSGLEFSGA